jgi:hypothetical protein
MLEATYLGNLVTVDKTPRKLIMQAPVAIAAE